MHWSSHHIKVISFRFSTSKTAVSSSAFIKGLNNKTMSSSQQGKKGNTPVLDARTADDQKVFKMQCIEDLHKSACLSGTSTYIDPATGYSVFTKDFHLKRGKCCGNSCRHCPYDRINVRK
jgi:hypothetical protein